jgi:hypothetical protein
MAEQGNKMMMYVLYYNKTAVNEDVLQIMEPLAKDPKLIKLHEDIDNSILKMYHDDDSTEEAPRIKSTYGDYPEP